MKWTRILNVVKVLLLAVLAAGFSASLASAQDVQGQFTLPFAARWGQATLPPGEYSFRLDAATAPYIATVRQGNRGVAIVMSSEATRGEISGPSTLFAVRSGGKYTIRALRLAEVGVTLEYLPPKAERQVLAQAPVLIQRIRVLSGK